MTMIKETIENWSGSSSEGPFDSATHLPTQAEFDLGAFVDDDDVDAAIANASEEDFDYRRALVASIEGWHPEIKAMLGMTA
jgi:hypothetical protein